MDPFSTQCDNPIQPGIDQLHTPSCTEQDAAQARRGTAQHNNPQHSIPLDHTAQSTTLSPHLQPAQSHSRLLLLVVAVAAVAAALLLLAVLSGEPPPLGHWDRCRPHVLLLLLLLLRVVVVHGVLLPAAWP
jgi:hypothetical protein